MIELVTIKPLKSGNILGVFMFPWLKSKPDLSTLWEFNGLMLREYSELLASEGYYVNPNSNLVAIEMDVSRGDIHLATVLEQLQDCYEDSALYGGQYD